MQEGYLFTDYFNYKFPMPQYLGAKYRHLSWIEQNLPKNIQTALDVFAGSQSVAFFFKQLGYKVYTNDFMNFSHKIGLALIENNGETLNEQDLSVLLTENSNPEYYNLMEKIFAGVFFTLDECRFLDAFRSNVEKLPAVKQALALAVMNRAMTRKVTMGHFAHAKALEYANNEERIKRNRSLIRPLKTLFLELLKSYNSAIFDNGKENKSFNCDAIELIESLPDKIDLAYFDPPYCNSHADYQAFYHLLETYTKYWKDKKFMNCVHSYYPKYHSGFDTKAEIVGSLNNLFAASVKIPYWLVSYNDRSYPTAETMLEILSAYKNVKLCEKEYTNSIGGKGSVKGSKEILFVCCPK